MGNLKYLCCLFLFTTVFGCPDKENREKNKEKTVAETKYVWEKITDRAAFPPGYNYPVFELADGNLLALNQGGWTSKDGATWTKTALTESNLNSAYQKYVYFKGVVVSLGRLSGDFRGFSISPPILYTTDGQSWRVAGKNTNLPKRVFYGAVVFKNKIWLAGGFDGQKYYNDVWNSINGVHWTRVTERAAWSERIVPRIVVFKDKIWIIGGGVIDGAHKFNAGAESEIWSSKDGVKWKKAAVDTKRRFSGTPIVFDDKLWLVGVNRADGNFASAVLCSDDGVKWHEKAAPWSPRGGAVVWVSGGKLYITGGKYSFTENGETKFVYSSDVWTMGKIPNSRFQISDSRN